MTADVAKVLESAADLLEKPGAWGQGSYYPRAGCTCALGALAKASGIEPAGNWDNYTKRLPYQAATLAFGGVNEAVQFNDRPGRTQAEVVAKLREASALARSEASS